MSERKSVTREDVARALFDADRPSEEWPTWEVYLASFGHDLTVDEAWRMKANAIFDALPATPPPSGDVEPQWEACKVCGGDHWTKDHHKFCDPQFR